MPRRSLRDRNREAIALDPEAVDPAGTTPGEGPHDEQASTAGLGSASPTAEPGKTATGARKKATTTSTSRSSAARPAAPSGTRRRSGSGLSETARLGIYLTPQEFEAAKAGYLADWSNGGEADTFARWIAAAIDAYATKSPPERAGAPARGRADERTGASRSFSIPTDTLARMRAAVSADHQAGRWPSDSAWCGEAIAAAVAEARDRNGGTLPTPPPRLPNRLVR